VRRQQIEVTTHSRAGPDVVFDCPCQACAIRDYRASVDLEPIADGTVIHWRSSFLPKVPGTGWVIRRGIGSFIERCAQGLVDYAVQRQAEAAGRNSEGA
jgi:hypothetical protein